MLYAGFSLEALVLATKQQTHPASNTKLPCPQDAVTELKLGRNLISIEIGRKLQL